MSYKFSEKVNDFIILMNSPSLWLQNSPYSKSWDKELNHLLDTEVFKYDYPLNDLPNYVSKVEARLGQRLIWICNHPYASFTIKNDENERVRPARITILRARRKLMDQELNRLWLYNHDSGKDDPNDMLDVRQ